MEACYNQNSLSDDLRGATPGHEKLRHPHQVPKVTHRDLFTLASSLGWSKLETERLRNVYGIALGLDQTSDMGQAPKPTARGKSK